MKSWVSIAMVASAGVLGACSWGGVTQGGAGGAGGEGGTSTGWGSTTTSTSPNTGWNTGTATSTSTWTTTTNATICDQVCARVENECGYGDLCGAYGITCYDAQTACSLNCVAYASCGEMATLLGAIGSQNEDDFQTSDPGTQYCVDSCWGTTPTGTTTSTGATCDDSGDCQTCADCAMNPGGACVDVAQTCWGNQDCIDFNACRNDCSDQACADACVEASPGGVDDFNALLGCVLDDACPVSCN
jgi:hypothetical protein